MMRDNGVVAGFTGKHDRSSSGRPSPGLGGRVHLSVSEVYVGQARYERETVKAGDDAVKNNCEHNDKDIRSK